MARKKTLPMFSLWIIWCVVGVVLWGSKLLWVLCSMWLWTQISLLFFVSYKSCTASNVMLCYAGSMADDFDWP